MDLLVRRFFATLTAVLIIQMSLFAPAIATDTGSVTAELKSSGKGGVAINDMCPQGSLISEVSASSLIWESNSVLTKTSGTCAQIADNGKNLLSNNFKTDLRGLSAGGANSSIKCPSGKAASGVIVFNTPQTNYVSGIKLKCSGLPFADSPYITETLGTQTAFREELLCPENSFVVGFLTRSGWIIDSFGVRCATIINVDQAPLSKVLLSSNSKAYPYEENIKLLGADGGDGQGALSITSVSDGTSLGCTLAEGILSSRKSGTCILTVTKAGDELYAPVTENVTFTFIKAKQGITIKSLGDISDSQSLSHALTVVISEVKGRGEIRFEVRDGTASGCKLSDFTAKAELTAESAGTCLVSAVIESDGNFEAAKSIPAVFTFIPVVTSSPTSNEMPKKFKESGPISYDPATEPGKTVDLQIAAFALLSIAAAGATAIPRSSQQAGHQTYRREDDENDGDEQNSSQRQAGEIASADSSKLTFNKRSAAIGDLYGFWRLAHVPKIETKFTSWVEGISHYSPIASRILIDGSYLRAMFSFLAFMPTFIGMILGMLMLRDAGLQPLPAAKHYFIIAIALGVIDSLAGTVIAAVIFIGTFLSGNIDSLDQFMTLIGLSALVITPALIASSIRPLRRTVFNMDDLWERATDYLLSILLGGWAVEKLIGALNGLAGLQLPITEYAKQLGLFASLFILLRLILEDLATHYFPERLLTQAAEFRSAHPAQPWFSLLIKTVIFFLVSYQFLGTKQQLFWGTLVFIIPSIVSNIENKFSIRKSNIARLLLPIGTPKIVIMVFIGGFFANWVKSLFSDPKIFIAWSFVVLAIPNLFFGLLKIFVAPAEQDWKSKKFGKLVYRFGGIAIAGLVFAIYRGVDLYALVMSS